MRIGIDLGGTKIEAIALDDAGSVLVRRRVPSPSRSYPEILKMVAELVDAIERELNQRGTVGIGSPGALSKKTGLMQNSNSTVLNGRPFERDLTEALARPIRLANDANCFALSEAIDGAGAASRVVFGAILGTGVGGGIIVDSREIEGRNAIAGEWGHTPLPWRREEELTGWACYCGRSGCIETFLSGPALERDYCTQTSCVLTAREIAQAAEAGEEYAIACVERYVDRLSRSLAVVIDILDPEMIVLGGGLSNIEIIYRRMPNLIGGYVFSDTCDTPIRRALHGDSSGVRGAAWLWPVTATQTV